MTSREPVFTETMQLGIIVRDLEATVRRYEDDYGIGPWQFAQIDLGAVCTRFSHLDAQTADHKMSGTG